MLNLSADKDTLCVTRYFDHASTTTLRPQGKLARTIDKNKSALTVFLSRHLNKTTGTRCREFQIQRAHATLARTKYLLQC